MLLAKWLGKPLLVRHCGNWLVQKTKAEHFWKSFMEKNAGGKNVMLVTGLEDKPASTNPNIKWIFSSSLRKEEIDELQKHRPTFDPQNPRLIIACRQDKPKGTGVVIEALSKLKAKHPSIHLDVLGEGYDLDYFKSLAKELDLNDNVTFHGKVNHDTVLELMQKAHIFCYPTAASEGFPKVVHEALASGLPVVGTPVSAIKRLLKNGAGILIEKPDPNELSLAIETILSDSGLYYDMQEKAIQAAESFSLDAWRDEIKAHVTKAWAV
jgi:glycosyltransferase involved in cell wall biosynthesis